MILHIAVQVVEVEVRFWCDVGLAVLEDLTFGDVGKIVPAVAAAYDAGGVDCSLDRIIDGFADVVGVDRSVGIDEGGYLGIAVPLVEGSGADRVLTDDLGQVVTSDTNLLLGEDTAEAGVGRTKQRKTVVAVVFEGRLDLAAVIEDALVGVVGNGCLVFGDEVLREVRAGCEELIGERRAEDVRDVEAGDVRAEGAGQTAAGNIDAAQITAGRVVLVLRHPVGTLFNAVHAKDLILIRRVEVHATARLPDIVVDQVRRDPIVDAVAGRIGQWHLIEDDLAQRIQVVADVAIDQSGTVGGSDRNPADILVGNRGLVCSAARMIGAGSTVRHDGVVRTEILLELRLAEVTGTHSGGRNEGGKRGISRASVGVDVALCVVFCARKEGQMSGLVEVCTRDENGTADGTARIDIAIVGLRLVGIVGDPVVCVELGDAAVGIEGAVELVTTRLADGVDDDRAVSRVCREARSLNLYLCDLLIVDVLECAAEGTRVGDVDTVRQQRGAVERRTVRSVLTERTGGIDLGRIVLRVVHVAGAAIGDGEAGKNLQELGDVAAFDGEVLDLFGRDQRALFAGVGVDGVDSAGDLNNRVRSAGGEMDIADRALVAWIKVDSVLLEAGEARSRDGDVVGSGGKGGEGEDAGSVAL